jgi:hypothetical protein
MKMRLEDLLQDDQRDRAFSILRKALDPANNLPISELRKALDLDFVKKHEDEITTGAIMGSEDGSAQADASSGKPKTRIRLSHEDKKAIMGFALGLIHQSPGIDTGEIVAAVQREFRIAQKPVIMEKLSELEREHLVVGTNTRPRRWTGVPTGQQHGESVKVRKSA